MLVHKHGATCVDGAPLSGGCATRVEGCCDQKIVTLQSPAINGSRAIGSNNAPVADEYYVVVPECKSGASHGPLALAFAAHTVLACVTPTWVFKKQNESGYPPGTVPGMRQRRITRHWGCVF